MKESKSICDTCPQRSACADKEKADSCAVERMSRIKHKIIIASGKGGVGNSTVAVNLAWALKSKGYTVGLIDAELPAEAL